ncbi:AzlC protein (fragment) [Candidatus Sulfotelmatobacter kueseliae]|uniref:AzlC protein n=1 Tax=Candidatus Sulfotelmatobacter kueseliae TaxID=2042962 RepID=A0A2U3KKN6_9BACT
MTPPAVTAQNLLPQFLYVAGSSRNRGLGADSFYAAASLSCLRKVVSGLRAREEPRH